MNDSAFWARGLKSPEGFQEEQAALGHYWTLLGVTSDVARDNDWFRTTLGGRSVFVQRFGGELRAFENVCVHRFYPLRTEDKGNGHIRCGFHHWQYNKDGLAVGIPKCQELFGKTPREMDARLKPVEIASCGMLIFGRFPSRAHTQTLEEYLGEGFAILAALWPEGGKPYAWQKNLAANWKLAFHISLDDYHVVAVHPDSFGKDGYLPLDAVKYFRFGPHSAYLWHGAPDELAKMRDQCIAGTYRPAEYRILQLFPNMLMVQFSAAHLWYVHIQQFIPLAHDRTGMRGLWMQSPFQPADDGFWMRVWRRIGAPLVPWFVPYYMNRIARQDNEVCEGTQSIAAQIDGGQIYGRHEERILWFEEEYRRALTGR